MTLSVYGRPWKADAQTDHRRPVEVVNIGSAVGLLVRDMAGKLRHHSVAPTLFFRRGAFICRTELSEAPLMDSAFHIWGCVVS